MVPLRPLLLPLLALLFASTSVNAGGLRPHYADTSRQGPEGFTDARLEHSRKFQYDPAGRLADHWYRDNSANLPARRFHYEYDANNNRTRIFWPDNWAATYGYDVANRMSWVSFPGGYSSWTYDSQSRRAVMYRSNGSQSNWTWEADGDLAGVFNGLPGAGGPDSVWQGHGYTRAGQLTETNTSRPDMEWSPPVDYARDYAPANARNQVVGEAGAPIGFNTRGQMTTDGRNQFTWEIGGRLMRATWAGGGWADYWYDADDQRHAKVVNGVVTRTLWSGGMELGEAGDDGNILRRFVPGPNVDERVAGVEADETVTYYHTDRQGSVILATNNVGLKTAQTTYSPYGEHGGGPYSIPAGGSFGYTGRQFDPETGLYYYRARYYIPRLGQFASMDPLESKDDPNQYMYVTLDPMNKTDPTGEEFVLPSPRTVGYAAAGVGVEVGGLGPEDPLADAGAAFFFRRAAISYGGDLARAATGSHIGRQISESRSKASSADKKKPLSPNQMQDRINKGQAPKGVDRIDKGKVEGEQDHAHLGKDAINKDGTTKHGNPQPTNDQKRFLKKGGWKLE